MTLPEPGALSPEPRALSPEAEVDLALALVEEILTRETGSEEPLVQDMARHVTLAGGKRVRPRLAVVAYRACGGTGFDWIVDAAAALELIHAASLVHDDIIDHSDVRRGRWTVHASHGLPAGILVGDYLFTRGFGLAGRMDETAVRAFADACVALCEGEVLEGQWQGRSDMPRDVYLTVIRKKTADVLRAACFVGAHLAGAPARVVDALAQYGQAVGMAFQVWDDVLDLKSDTATLGKPVGIDFREGVNSLPFILHRERGGTLPRWRRSRERVLAALRETGSLEECERIAHAYADEARRHLREVPEGPYRDMLEKVAVAVVTRDA